MGLGRGAGLRETGAARSPSGCGVPWGAPAAGAGIVARGGELQCRGEGGVKALSLPEREPPALFWTLARTCAEPSPGSAARCQRRHVTVARRNPIDAPLGERGRAVSPPLPRVALGFGGRCSLSCALGSWEELK